MNEEFELEELAPWVLGFVTLIGGGLRLLLLGTKGMWLDETFSVWLANQSVVEMLQWTVKIDQHPPLYYYLLHYWIALVGDTPYYARLLSVLFGTGTIPMIYLIGKRLSGVMVGLVAAVFLALSPFNIYYAQETRMYTLLTFNTAVAIYALVRLLTDSRAVSPIGSQFRDYLHAWRTSGPVEPDSEEGFSYKITSPRTGLRAWIYRHRWSPIQTIETDLAWVAFVVFSAATLLSHNTAVLFPLATNIFVLGLILFPRKQESDSPPAFQAPTLGNWVKAQIGIFLLWSPWIFAFIKQASGVYQRFWIPEPTWDAVIHVLASFLNPSMSYLEGGQVTGMWILYALVLGLGLVHFRKKWSPFLLLATLFAIPFLGELLVSIRRPIFYDRTLIWTTIPLFLVLAAGVAQLKFRPLMFLALGSLVTFNLFSIGDYYRFYQKEDWSTAAGYVALFAEKDDLVLFNSNFVEIPFDYYFKTYENLYGTQVEKQGIPLDLFDSGILEPTMTESDIPELISLLHGHSRVWLVYSHNSYTDPMELIPQTLASQRTLTRQRNFYGGQVQLYETP
ncbi:MAG: glycosyltransferase family 39 protein [Anaerolineaceae bacterium]|nr:glycosyltransferase family 39 protein [Anaerolineaceae bacterium]